MRALLVVLVAGVSSAAEPVVGAGHAAEQQQPPSTGETTVVAPRGTQQPGWTERRLFPGTRIYVAPAGSATFEFWLENKTPFGKDNRLRTLYELALGLGHRLQLDLYVRTQADGLGAMFLESERLELRWALADWGVIPGNPTVYLEWIRQTAGPMKGEVKLLFGGELSPRVFWGVNLFYERELWGTDQTQEYGVTAGLTFAALPDHFSLGGELRVELVDTRTRRFNPDGIEVLVGPTFAWRPVPAAHVLLVWFLGPELERSAPDAPYAPVFVMQPTLVAGWRF